MTVAELKAKLSEYPDDMPVMATWETVCRPFVSESFEVVPAWDMGKPEDAADTLFIDVECRYG
jgi:hypothetical protein